MWLRELQIRNFRKIDALTVTFPRGLTVLVGENNSGKTTSYRCTASHVVLKP